MTPLPFNFERLSSNKVFISNIGGFSNIIDSDDLVPLIESPSDLGYTKRHELQQQNFITTSDDYKLSITTIASAFAKRLTAEIQFNPVFMVVPTLRCDHTCKYCQVARAPIEQTQYDLKESDLALIVQRILVLGKAPYCIEIQGGEPLIRFDLIQKLYDLCESELIEFKFVIASSLSLLTNDILNWAKSRNVDFSMSLDGLKEAHDANRILASDSSYHRAIQGALAVKSTLGLERLGVVTTITKDSLKSYEELVKSHLDLGITSFFIRPLSPYGFAGKKEMGSYELTDYFIFYRNFLKRLKELWLIGHLVSEHSIGVHIKRLISPTFNSYADLKSPSGFGLNAILFNYDGRIFGSDEARMLQRLHPGIDFSLGDLSDNTLNISAITKSIVDGGINYNKPGCVDCAFQPFCGADPLQNISLFGESIGHKAHSPFCEYHKGMFRIALEYLYGSPEDKSFILDVAQ